MNLLRESLKNKGLRITPARIAVLKVLQESGRPMDIPAILREVGRQKVDADQATIYRIVENFIHSELISRLQFNEKKFFYEAKKFDHHHLICDNCGKVEDILSCTIDRVEREIEKVRNFKVKRHALEFFGICGDCLVRD